MQEDVRKEIVSAIEAEIISTLPIAILGFYRNLPGRRPSDHSRRVSETLYKLDDQESIELIRDIIDRTVFSLINLMDESFKEKKIMVTFVKDGASSDLVESPLLETYRKIVDPGGIISI